MTSPIDARDGSRQDGDGAFLAHGAPWSGEVPALESPLPGARPLTIAHDYFTQRGGAERVAAAMVDALIPDRIVTALCEPAATFAVPPESIETSMLQRNAAFRADPRRALPLLPLAWGLVPPVLDGLVICSSSGWSHGIPVGPEAKKIVYCHNPARWLYQREDFFRDQSRAIKAVAAVIRPALTRWDRSAAGTADLYLANSTSVAARIRAAYDREAIVLPPPVSIDGHGAQEQIEGVEPGFFLTVGRGRGYKNVERIVEGFAGLRDERLVIVGARPVGDLPANVQVLHDLSDAQLRWLYASARALLSVSHEDFGLTPLEANMFGTPALLAREGGFLDSLDEGVSGLFLDEPTAAGIRDGVRRFPDRWDEREIVAHAERFALGAFIERLTSIVDEVMAS